MRLLVLGGTEFVGRAVVDEALARGDEVTVLNRGRRAAPAGVVALRGDRAAADGLSAIGQGEWDVVVDTWSAAPVAVRDAARLLADRASVYAYVSSRSVYAFPPAANAAEEGELVDGSPDAGPGTPYGEAKRGGELAAQAGFGDRALLLRAGLILGPHENVGRLPWWLRRIARGGVIVAPGPRDLPLQYLDARDLAIFTLDAAQGGLGGAFNVVSPAGHSTMEELLQTCVQVTGAGVELRWFDPDVILAAGVEPWTDLPIWLPPGELHDGLHRGDVSKAVAAGLHCRPVGQTVADTWAWLTSLAGGEPPQRGDLPPLGLSAEAEARLLAM